MRPGAAPRAAPDRIATGGFFMATKQPQTPDKKSQISKEPERKPRPAKVEFDLPDEELEKVSGGGRSSNLST